MKTSITTFSLLFFVGFFLFSNTACNKEDDDVNNNAEQLSAKDQEDLLFLFEEEKMARDTYRYMDSLWSVNQFANIKESEQKHMDAIGTLLDKYEITYTIQPVGIFNNSELQALYDQFISDGATNKNAALQIGATIEDMDIYDLKNYIEQFKQADIDQALEKLLCASGNHMRAFTKAIENNGGTYTPQYITESEYQEILAGQHENCH